MSRRTASELLLASLMTMPICLSFSMSQPCLADETNSSVLKSPYFAPETVRLEKKETPARAKLRQMSVSQLEKHMFDLVNKDRTAAGVEPLVWHPALNRMARRLAEDMLKNDFFGHETSDGSLVGDRARKEGITCGVYENLGEQSGPDPVVQMVDELQKSFMSEPEGKRNHRYIILYPKLQFAGIGIAKSKDEVVVVQDFTEAEPTARKPEN